jgi:hypothetical protein
MRISSAGGDLSVRLLLTMVQRSSKYLSKRCHLNHIRISGYNSRANGTVERSHFDVRQSLFKVVDGDQKRWSLGVYSVFGQRESLLINAWDAHHTSPSQKLTPSSLLT